MDAATPEQVAKLRQAIALLETQQNDFGLDLAAQVADLRQRLRDLTTISQSGSGSVATGGVAGGENSVVVAGAVYGNIYHLYQSPPGAAMLSPDDFERILNDYLRWVYQTYSRTRLYGIESVQGPPVRNLANVFVPLSLRRFAPLRRQEVEALADDMQGDTARAYRHLVDAKRHQGDRVTFRKLLPLHNHLAIIGGAGSGKSTLLAYLAAHLAAYALQRVRLAIELPEGKPALVPLVIPLRYVRDYEQLCEQSPQERLRDPRAGTLAGFIPWYLARFSPIKTAEDFLHRLLQGGGCLLMLDGLDEVVSRDARGRMRQRVEHLVQEVYPDNQVIVTAREAGYRGDAVFGDDFVRLDVQRLRSRQIRVLVARWCRQLYGTEAVSRTAELMAAIEGINDLRSDRELPPFISTPLMSTMVVSVKWGEAELPRERAKLYEACVKVILQAQYIRDDEARQDLVEWGGLWEEQRNWLAVLAVAMHAGGEAGAAVPEEQVRAALTQELAPAALDAFLVAVRHRGGLLEEKAELFQFLHLTFQEFLVARWLTKQRHEGLPHLQPHLGEDWWREVALLTYGFAQMDHPPFARVYLEWLSTQEGPGDNRLAGLELAGAALLELERPDPAVRLQQALRLQEALGHRNLPGSARLRARAGHTLGSLGDSRFRADAAFLPDEAWLGFVEIPAGPFWMGSAELDREARENEKPQHQVTLPRYFIACYPVTVAQFRVFVEASDHRPSDPDCLKGFANHPVVWVNWSDALAYCRWLTAYLGGADDLPEPLCELVCNQGWQVTLPSEAEWEKAARGSQDKRRYPWGDAFEAEWVNHGGAGIFGTNAVGVLPQGASPYGCLDMCGNVWEWTRSLHGDYPYPSDEMGRKKREDLQSTGEEPRVLRGGAFRSNPQDVRCAVRDDYDARLAYYDVGFRVVLSALP